MHRFRNGKARDHTPRASTPRLLIVAPWGVSAHGGVNGVIRSLVEHMRLDGRVSPLIIQNSWDHKNVSWKHRLGIPVGSMRIRPLVSSNSDHSSIISVLAYLAIFPKFAYSFSTILRRCNVNTVNIHYPSLGSMTFCILKRLGLLHAKLVLSFHGSDLFAGITLTGFRARLWLMLLSAADDITCVSNYLATALINQIPSARPKVHVIHNGVDFDTFSSPACQCGRLECKSETIISIASFDYVKGVDVLLRAIAMVAAKRPDIKVLLVGESGTEDERLVLLASELHISGKVEWCRTVHHDEIPRLLGKADVFVLPSRNEGLPLALLEAGSRGLPCIATRVGGTPEIITNEETGLLVPPEDPNALATAILMMLADRNWASRLGLRLQAKVRDQFTWQRACAEYVRLSLAPPHARSRAWSR